MIPLINEYYMNKPREKANKYSYALFIEMPTFAFSFIAREKCSSSATQTNDETGRFCLQIGLSPFERLFSGLI